MAAVHVRVRTRGRDLGPGPEAYDPMVRNMQRPGPPGLQVLRATTSSQRRPSRQRLDDTTGPLATRATTARATATAAA
jgi:hypothetical protein